VARLGGPTTPAGTVLSPAATAHPLRPTVSEGWRHATPTRGASHRPPERSGGEIPAPQPASPSSATGLAGAAAMALLGLLAILFFAPSGPAPPKGVS
jgi:hypothetical protein